ncbi:uncharacterized protein LOC121739270 [Aricia agestis]|uniref:uncharacterized protein LOC121739270 n=1 Tax=Aricia agestis TaxID=91739 RepID=UPI001C201679|nr:uncharacterized protein LOC121739270 [Aricia agestis]
METATCENYFEKFADHNYSDNVKDSIASIIKNNCFVKCTVNIKDIDTNNGNYLAQLYEVDIKGETNKGEKEINLFFKESLTLEKIEVLNIDEVYDRELFIYQNFASIANKLQDEAKIPEDERYVFVPEYGGNVKIIILENLSKQDFKTYYRMDVMPIKYAQLAIKALAKFHSLSFVVKEKMPEYFEEHVKTKKANLNFNDDWSKFISNVCESTAKLVARNQESIRNYAPKMKERLIKSIIIPTPISCLTHGDYRLNNILVKELDGEPTAVAVVDYQLINYGNPLRDFFYFIYTGSDRKFRLDHLEDLKNLYYQTMTNFLAYFDLDINDVYPKEEFEKDFVETREHGLMVGLYSGAFIFIPDEDSIDTSKVALSEIDCSNLDVRFKERAQEMIDEFIGLGIL